MSVTTRAVSQLFYIRIESCTVGGAEYCTVLGYGVSVSMGVQYIQYSRWVELLTGKSGRATETTINKPGQFDSIDLCRFTYSTVDNKNHRQCLGVHRSPESKNRRNATRCSPMQIDNRFATEQCRREPVPGMSSPKEGIQMLAIRKCDRYIFDMSRHP